ncbi:MAG: alkaline phosphatase [Saprospiraceae bacterium]|nr:alkaline phosphatase [Saprospiraceae bacterium]
MVFRFFVFINCLFFLLGSCSTAKKQIDSTKSVQSESESIQKKKNIILLIGDGMGIAQISAALYMNNNQLALERCTHVGLQKSHAADDLITDSASSATAFSTGQKTKNGSIGMDPNGQKLETILEEANRKGFVTGLVVTSSIVHATPAAFAAHQPSRDMYENIAMNMSQSGCNLMIGGGKKYFDRRISDSLNLTQLMISNGYVVTDYFESDFRQYIFPQSDKMVYFTADGDPLPVNKGRDYLPKASLHSIEFLDRIHPSNGFFLMIEGSQIDWGGHANETEYVVAEMLDFDKTVKVALDFAEKDKNTLVIVTGDHETGGMAINPGSRMGQLSTSYSTTHHTAELIPVFAFGPGAENFSGIYENTALYHKMRKFLFGLK